MKHAIAAIGLAAALALAPAGPGMAQGKCDPGDKPDNTTATDARKKIVAAGYAEPRNLKKGCDNFWHGTASRGGRAVNVVLAPDGTVRVETD